MEIDKLNEAARRALQDANQLLGIADEVSAFSSMAKSAIAQFQRSLDKATEFHRALGKATEFQRTLEALDKSTLIAFHKQVEEDAARMRALFDDKRISAFDSILQQAAERFTSVVENRAVFQSIALSEKQFAAAVAAQKYLEDQARQWDGIRNSVVHNIESRIAAPPAEKYTIKAKLPKIQTSPQAQLDFRSAPEPTVEIPSAARWLASAMEVILTKGAYKRTVEPHVVDMRDEYQDAIRGGKNGRAAWAIVRGHLVIVATQLNRLKGWLGFWS